MYIDKEITILRLRQHCPDGCEYDEWVEGIARRREDITLCYSHGNEMDPECMVGRLRTRIVGYVNADDQKYIRRMLRESPSASCRAQFVELRREAGHSDVLVYSLIIDTSDVDDVVPDRLWNTWSYEGPVLSSYEDDSAVQYCIGEIVSLLSRRADTDMDAVEEYVCMLADAIRYDLSCETSNEVDKILFLLEMRRTPETRRLKTLLQRANTKRRCESTHKEFVSQFWPRFVEERQCLRLRDEYMSRHHWVSAGMDGCSCRATQHEVSEALGAMEQTLLALPYGIYQATDDLQHLRNRLFYTHIPRAKQRELMSLLVLQHWVRQLATGCISIQPQYNISITGDNATYVERSYCSN